MASKKEARASLSNQWSRGWIVRSENILKKEGFIFEERVRLARAKGGIFHNAGILVIRSERKKLVRKFMKRYGITWSSAVVRVRRYITDNPLKMVLNIHTEIVKLKKKGLVSQT